MTRWSAHRRVPIAHSSPVIADPKPETTLSEAQVQPLVMMLLQALTTLYRAGPRVSLLEAEETAQSVGRWVGNAFLRLFLAMRFARELSERVPGRTYRKVTKKMRTLVGEVFVDRLSEKTDKGWVVAADAQLGIPTEMFSQGVRQRTARLATQLPFSKTRDVLADEGISVAKRQVQELTVRAAKDVERMELNRPVNEVPKDSFLLLTLDSKAVRMHKKDLRPKTREAAEAVVVRVGDPFEKPPKRAHKSRMAIVSVVQDQSKVQRKPSAILDALFRRGSKKKSQAPHA
jgi:hypothetical protein